MLQGLQQSHMIQEQRQFEYRFLRGDYASIKIKMQPKSLVLDIPLDWQINKIKCLLVRILPKLEFDMFIFKHHDEEVPGNYTLRALIELDNDQDCINSDHLTLVFKKLNSKEQYFEKFYAMKRKEFVESIENSPFEPILHPGYYSMKQMSHLPFDASSELLANFNQLQQMQNVIHEQRRQLENQQGGFLGLGWGGNEGANNGGVVQFIGVGIIRIIQIVSILTIIRFITYNSDMEVFIIIGVVMIIYFLINHLKKKPAKPADVEPAAPEVHQGTVEEASFLEKRLGLVKIFAFQRICLVVECLITYFLSLFPNWTVELHKEWFSGINHAIEGRINHWKQAIQPKIPQPMEESPMKQPQNPIESQSQRIVANQNSEQVMQKQHQE